MNENKTVNEWLTLATEKIKCGADRKAVYAELWEHIEDKILEIAEGEGQISTAEDKYIAVSFFLKNITTDKQYYNEMFKIKEATQGIEKALRVMLIKDYDITVYAAKDAEGNDRGIIVNYGSTEN